jgi:hypothetical protein
MAFSYGFLDVLAEMILNLLQGLLHFLGVMPGIAICCACHGGLLRMCRFRTKPMPTVA